jgi:DMSO/TMAO reductase YedYZ molybdopterin-dependent catalytic subunit
MTDRTRVPPGQTVTTKFPVLHEGAIPEFDPKNWDLRIEGEVESPIRLSWDQFSALPTVESTSDFHCVTTWSRLDNLWVGVPVRHLLDQAGPKKSARFVLIGDSGFYSTDLKLSDLMGEDVLLATAHDAEKLSPEHGGPVRLVVPHKYAYKAVKWVRWIRVLKNKELGYWEQRGYSSSADPWKQERNS